MDTLAKRLRYAREQANLSQSALARSVGVKPQAIQSIEAGRVHRPRALLEIADVLGVSPMWLSSGEGSVEMLRVHEPTSRYASHESSKLSTEAVRVASLWMELPKAQRAAILETLRALSRDKKQR